MADPPESCRHSAVRPTTRPRCFPSHRWFQRQLNTRLSRRRPGEGREITDVFSRPDSMSHAIPFSLSFSSLHRSVYLSSLPPSHLPYPSSQFSLSLSLSPLRGQGNGDETRDLARRLKINAVRALEILNSLGLNAEFDKCAPFRVRVLNIYIYIYLTQRCVSRRIATQRVAFAGEEREKRKKGTGKEKNCGCI